MKQRLFFHTSCVVSDGDCEGGSVRTQCEAISLDAVRYLRFEHSYPAITDICIGIHSSHRFQEIRLCVFIPGIEQTWSSTDSEHRGDIQANKDGSRTVPWTPKSQSPETSSTHAH